MDPKGMSPKTKARTLTEEVEREKAARVMPPPKKKVNWRLWLAISLISISAVVIFLTITCGSPAQAEEPLLGCCTQAEILAKASYRAIDLIEAGRSFDAADVLESALISTER